MCPRSDVSKCLRVGVDMGLLAYHRTAPLALSASVSKITGVVPKEWVQSEMGQ